MKQGEQERRDELQKLAPLVLNKLYNKMHETELGGLLTQKQKIDAILRKEYPKL